MKFTEELVYPRTYPNILANLTRWFAGICGQKAQKCRCFLEKCRNFRHGSQDTRNGRHEVSNIQHSKREGVLTQEFCQTPIERNLTTGGSRHTTKRRLHAGCIIGYGCRSGGQRLRMLILRHQAAR